MMWTFSCPTAAEVFSKLTARCGNHAKVATLIISAEKTPQDYARMMHIAPAAAVDRLQK